MTESIEGIAACVFDAYGTLFDVAAAARSCTAVPAERRAELAQLWRDKQLQYSWLRTLAGRHADFWTVTADALDYALEALGLPAGPIRAELLQLYWALAAFPEVPAVLSELRGRGFRTAILSNGSPPMLDAAVNSAGISPLLDAVLSVEDAGAFKTDPRTYQLCLDRLGLPAERILFISSNGWDAWAASAFGMVSVWCNRAGQPAERLPGAPAAIIAGLDALPALLAAPA